MAAVNGSDGTVEERDVLGDLGILSGFGLGLVSHEALTRAFERTVEAVAATVAIRLFLLPAARSLCCEIKHTGLVVLQLQVLKRHRSEGKVCQGHSLSS